MHNAPYGGLRRKGAPNAADIKGRADIPYTPRYQKILTDLGQLDGCRLARRVVSDIGLGTGALGPQTLS